MRVALISYNARAGDAIGNSVAEKMAFFRERGAEVRVLVECDAGLHPTLRKCCQVVRNVEARGDWWRFLTAADLIAVEYGQHYGLLNLLPLLAGAGPRILLDYHGVTPPGLWGPHNREALVKGVAQRGLAWCADAVLVHSRFTWRELHEECGLPSERLHLLGFVVEPRESAAGPSRLRRQLGLDEAFVLLFVGRLAPNKRVYLLVEALQRLRHVERPVHALVVGDAGDLYQEQKELCQARARELGLGDRLHFAGHLTGEDLSDAYRAADLFVTPSLWESFCIPVIEAMAHGVPVVAARAAALPETVADAGLTFTPNDTDDLARQVRRLLPEPTRAPSAALTRVAVVAARYGAGIVSGVERSLQTIAQTLHAAGHAVEVFTTCTRSESDWTNHLPAGTTVVEGIPVHRYLADRTDAARHADAVTAINQATGATAETERELLTHALHSRALLESLKGNLDRFDVVLTGPYASGLSFDAARALPQMTVLLPCFHDEPLARLAIWREPYGAVAGVLYHSPEEQDFAQATLGMNHPRAAVIGTWIESASPGHPEAGRRAACCQGRYVLYCGRYLREKSVDVLLDYAGRYHACHPDRFTFVFAGEGSVAVPRQAWARDLGFVSDERKRDLLAGADALVQLSRCESLSLVALEAWAEATPVIVDTRCPVLAGHVARSGGGEAVDGFEAFARALDDLWQSPERWRAFGRKGRDYVRAEHGSRTEFRERLRRPLLELAQPLRESARVRGLARARAFSRVAWRERFGEVVERVLHGEPLPCRHMIEVRRRAATRTVSAGAGTVLFSVRVLNWGTQPAAAEGPGRMVLRSRVADEQGREVVAGAEATSLPGLLMPGRSLSAAVPVPVPPASGTYQVQFWAEFAAPHSAGPFIPFITSLQLVVAEQGEAGNSACCGPLLETVQAALVEGDRLQRLPEDYLDVTGGLLAPLKRLAKRKLLGNFKRAYVDVLSRQQSALNRQVLSALQELVECCATLDHAVRLLQARLARLEGAKKKKKTGNDPSRSIERQPSGIGSDTEGRP